MRESELLSLVTDRADELGLLWHHCRDSRHCDGTRGFPDLLLAGPGGVLLAELKSDTGSSGPGQPRWRWSLAAVGVPAVTWWPRDWRSGAVSAALEVLAVLAARGAS